jgi:hypothetical protein
MKKLRLAAATAVLIALAAFGACRRDDGYSLGNYAIGWGTVEQGANNRVIIRRDNGSRLHIVDSRVPGSVYTAGKRVIVNYTILGEVQSASRPEYYAGINDLYRVLTKSPILQSFIDDAANRPDSIGDNRIHITNAWFGDHFINLRFNAYFGDTKAHLLTLVRDDIGVYGDDSVRLRLHHNAFDDPALYNASGYVSFDLSSILATAPAQTSVPVKLTWIGMDGAEHSDSGTFNYSPFTPLGSTGGHTRAGNAPAGETAETAPQPASE